MRNYFASAAGASVAGASVVPLASTGAASTGATSAAGATVSVAGATGASSFFEHPLKDATKPNVTRAVNNTFFIRNPNFDFDF
jgi:hypothetical protein